MAHIPTASARHIALFPQTFDLGATNHSAREIVDGLQKNGIQTEVFRTLVKLKKHSAKRGHHVLVARPSSQEEESRTDSFLTGYQAAHSDWLNRRRLHIRSHNLTESSLDRLSQLDSGPRVSLRYAFPSSIVDTQSVYEAVRHTCMGLLRLDDDQNHHQPPGIYCHASLPEGTDHPDPESEVLVITTRHREWMDRVQNSDSLKQLALLSVYQNR